MGLVAFLGLCWGRQPLRLYLGIGLGEYLMSRLRYASSAFFFAALARRLKGGILELTGWDSDADLCVGGMRLWWEIELLGEAWTLAGAWTRAFNRLP